ncbi:MAG: hypothetical protein ACPGD8_03220 [Flavobacteriales bacterium]
MLNRGFLVFILVGFGFSAFAQDEADTSSAVEETEVNKTAKRDSARAIRKAWNDKNTIYKPIIGLGAGVFNYFGEVNNNERTNPLINNYGFQASVIKNFSPSFGLRFDVAYGKITARERSVELGQNRNFSTDIVSFNVHATYNFAGILPPKRFLNPYISVGVGAINFDAKGDLRDENGVAYNYWADGTIRSLPFVDGGANDGAEILRTDYVYETDLRKANLDSLGEYAQFAFAIPVTFGLNFRVSNRSIIRLSSTFSYAFTDLIDNYTKDGVTGRKGNAANDMFLFTAISYHFDFFSEKKKKNSIYDDVEFFSLEGDDDEDGVVNEIDECPATPKGSAVNESGCPLDTDGDGVYDYADKEKNTKPDLNVDENGVGLTDDMIVYSEDDTLATLRARMYEVYPDLAEIYKSKKPKSASAISASSSNDLMGYEQFDVNKDGQVSVQEVYGAIDLFFEGELDVSPSYINGLIDFFFDQ